MKLLHPAAALALALAAASSHAQFDFVNGLAPPGSGLDASGGSSVNDGRLGYFSDLYFDPRRNEWWGLSDRGPGGGTLSYDTRVQRFSIEIDKASGAISNFKVAQTIGFSSNGRPLSGLAPNPANALGLAFDPEGFVVNPGSGNFLVSDEYGPSLYEFDRSGALLRTFTTPANLLPRNAATGTPNFAGDAGNDAGKRTNRGFEGLAISPDGRYAYAALQSAMLDEGGGDGTFSRVVKFDTASGNAVAQHAYGLDTAARGRGVSALVALGNDRFLILERNNRGVGVDANLAGPEKIVYGLDLAGATDVTGLDLDAADASFTAAVKGATLIDLDADTLAAFGNVSPEKWEGLAVGPRLDDGSYVLLAGTDNDYSVSQDADTTVQFDVYVNPTTGERVRCEIGTFSGCVAVGANGELGEPVDAGFDASGFALIPAALHAYRGAIDGYLAPVPEPQSYALMLLGLAITAAVLRRRRR